MSTIQVCFGLHANGRRFQLGKACRAALLTLAGLLVANTCAADDAGPDVVAAPRLAVRTGYGPVRGRLTSDGAVLRWLGIPYAQPPVAGLRWKAPQAPAPWSEVLDASSFGSPCAQLGSIYGPPPAGKPWGAANVEAFGHPVGAEDCLSLNIWRPNHEGSLFPVIVFVHGGSNIAGYSGDPAYDGAKLSATADAVIVTINYRLGLFGWFTHPAFQNEDLNSSSGNFGTLDIIQALRFVQSNVAAFGGDPHNVTLAGQSAGAVNVYSVMASPLGFDLFQKAMILSGLILSTTPEAGNEFSRKLAAQLIVDDGLAATSQAAEAYLARQDAPWVGQYLKSKTASALLAAQSRNPSLQRVPNCFGDGAVIPSDLKGGFERGQFRHVPTIVGLTRDEGKMFTAGVLKVTDAQRFTLMLNTDPDGPPVAKPKELITPYLLPFLGSGLYDAYAWLILAFAAHEANGGISRLARREEQVFAYRFDWNRGPEPWTTLYGAGHAIDLPFMFGNFSKNFFAMDFSRQNSPGREALSRIMMRAIGGFIRTGDPNVPELTTHWTPWGAPDGGKRKLVFDASDQKAILSTR